MTSTSGTPVPPAPDVADVVDVPDVAASLQASVRTPWGWIALAAVALVVVGTLALLIGPAGIGIRGAVGGLLDAVPGVDVDHGLTEAERTILLRLRLPRVVLGALVGGTLALAGAAYQGVFRNPLADPYLLGVAAGAGLGATVAIIGLGGGAGSDGGVAGLGGAGGALPLFAFAGAVAGVLATWVLGASVGGVRSSTSLILAGVAVAAFATAMQTYLQQRSADTLRVVYTWILGRLSTSGWSEVALVAPYVAVATVVVLVHRRALDVLAVGVDEADALGVPTARVRLLVIGAATLGTAAVVAVSGLIGFVGIVVPHAVRLALGGGHRTLLPLSLLGGAAFLVAVDLVARTAVSPAELPIGVVTAFVGAPFFLVVLRTSPRLTGGSG